jgi:hypothetical protein
VKPAVRRVFCCRINGANAGSDGTENRHSLRRKGIKPDVIRTKDPEQSEQSTRSAVYV